jgi:hypothetical protein
MAQIGTNATGQPVFVGDQCTITGVVASISGSGSTANVTVTTDKNDTVVVKPGDCGSETGGGSNSNADASATNPVQNNDAGRFAANSRVSVSGIVNSLVSGSGSTAQLSIRLASSQGLVTVSAGTLRSAPSQAGSFNT